jgi:5'-methylthioadenosine phosphorylase
MFGVLSSSGLPDLGRCLGLSEQAVTTPYGAVVAFVGEVDAHPIACIARHGDPALPPHRVNSRANLAALADLGCSRIFAGSAVGSLRADLRPPSLCIPDQILDFTTGRASTFFDDRMVAVDFTYPYCARVQALIRQATLDAGHEVLTGLVYACMQGPRFETAAEIRMLRALGADLVGMTAMPEAALAREKGMCYASLCVVTNLAAGVEGHRPSEAEVLETMSDRWEAVAEIVRRVVTAAAAYREPCACCGPAPA